MARSVVALSVALLLVGTVTAIAAQGAAASPLRGPRPEPGAADAFSFPSVDMPIDLDGTYTWVGCTGPPIVITGFIGWSGDLSSGDGTFQDSMGTQSGQGTEGFNLQNVRVMDLGFGAWNFTVSASASKVTLTFIGNGKCTVVNTHPERLASLPTISGTETKPDGTPFGPGAALNGSGFETAFPYDGHYEFWVQPLATYSVTPLPTPPGGPSFALTECSGHRVPLPNGCTFVFYKSLTPPHETASWVAQISGPTLLLKATDPTPVSPSGTTPLALKAKVSTDAPITKGKITVQLSPKVVAHTTTPLTATVGSVAGKTSKTVAIPGGQLAPTVIGDGRTLAGLTAWATANHNWHHSVLPKPHFSGGRLVYSDYPEYLQDSTEAGVSGEPQGRFVQGVLYKQRAGTYAADPASPDFRVFFNHENRTDVAKTICVVFSANRLGESVTEQKMGIVHLNNSNPVAAGRDAVAKYLASKGGGQTFDISTKVGKKTIPVMAYCPDGATLGTGAGAIATGIIDYTASGPANLKVGLVVLNELDAPSFVLDPLGYRFSSLGGSYTYASAPTLYNPDEPRGHVSGTFLHDQLSMEIEPCKVVEGGPEPSCSASDIDAGKLWGALILGTPTKAELKGGVPEDKPQYEQALDTKSYDYGGFGMLYDLTIPVTGLKGEADQVLLNDRGLGPQFGVNGAFAGVVTANGREISTPTTGNVKNPDLGIGIGQVKANTTFDLQLIPPAGSTFPMGIVLAPAFLKMQGTLTYNDGSTVKSTPDPTIIGLAPGQNSLASHPGCAAPSLLRLYEQPPAACASPVRRPWVRQHVERHSPPLRDGP